MRLPPATGVALLLACTKPAAPVTATTAPVPVVPVVPPPVVAVVEPPGPVAVAETPGPAAPAPTFARPADWPAAVLFPEVFDPGHTALAVGDHGDIFLRHSVPDTTVAAVAARWTETFTAGGFAPREPCTQAADHACVWVGHDRAVLVSASLDWSGRGVQAMVHWLPVGHTPVSRLPGPCVPPPTRARKIIVQSSGVAQDGERREGSTSWSVDSHPGADLDGDGRPERYVPHAGAGECPWDIPHDVYVMRGDCGHLVGTIVGLIDDATHLSGFHRGLRVVHTSATWASHGGKRPEPVHHTRTRIYTFDGRRLRQTGASSRDGVCHHCGVTYCHETR